MWITVIVSTYNNPVALEKSFWGWQQQSDPDFDILIADDGSGVETTKVIERIQSKMPGRVSRIWHEDDGFRKSKILNESIRVAQGEYLIFSDGDCIPRDDFVSAHRRCSRPNYFLSGGSHIDAPQTVHQKLSEQDVASQQAFEASWLTSRGMTRRFRRRLTRDRQLACLFDLLTPRPGVFTGANASAWKSDIVAINGFDSSSTYGSDDKELGARLTNNGVKSRQLKHSLVCLHQSHSRPYSREQIRLNKLKLKATKKHRVTWIANGIVSDPSEQSESRAA
jgi:glycosyltransferase involved in cell wall biosynthesis